MDELYLQETVLSLMQQRWREALGSEAWKATLEASSYRLQKAGLGNPSHSTMSSKKGIGKAIKKIFYKKKKSKTMKLTKRQRILPRMVPLGR